MKEVKDKYFKLRDVLITSNHKIMLSRTIYMLMFIYDIKKQSDLATRLSELDDLKAFSFSAIKGMINDCCKFLDLQKKISKHNGNNSDKKKAEIFSLNYTLFKSLKIAFPDFEFSDIQNLFEFSQGKNRKRHNSSGYYIPYTAKKDKIYGWYERMIDYIILDDFEALYVLSKYLWNKQFGNEFIYFYENNPKADELFKYIKEKVILNLRFFCKDFVNFGFDTQIKGILDYSTMKEYITEMCKGIPNISDNGMILFDESNILDDPVSYIKKYAYICLVVSSVMGNINAKLDFVYFNKFRFFDYRDSDIFCINNDMSQNGKILNNSVNCCLKICEELIQTGEIGGYCAIAELLEVIDDVMYSISNTDIIGTFLENKELLSSIFPNKNKTECKNLFIARFGTIRNDLENSVSKLLPEGFDIKRFQKLMLYKAASHGHIISSYLLAEMIYKDYRDIEIKMKSEFRLAMFNMAKYYFFQAANAGYPQAIDALDEFLVDTSNKKACISYRKRGASAAQDVYVEYGVTIEELSDIREIVKKTGKEFKYIQLLGTFNN